jgi:hypothetical protein
VQKNVKHDACSVYRFVITTSSSIYITHLTSKCVANQAQTVVFDTIQKENQKIIGDYIEARKTESNVSNNFQRLIGNTLHYL